MAYSLLAEIDWQRSKIETSLGKPTQILHRFHVQEPGRQLNRASISFGSIKQYKQIYLFISHIRTVPAPRTSGRDLLSLKLAIFPANDPTRRTRRRPQMVRRADYLRPNLPLPE